MERFSVVLILLLSCVACAEKDTNEAVTPNKESVGLPFRCSGSPPVIDKSKIEKMLRNNGRITADMNQQQVEKTVNDFIQKKQNKYKDCKKP